MSPYLVQLRVAFGKLRELTENAENQLKRQVLALLFALGVVVTLVWRGLVWILLIALILLLWVVFLLWIPFSILLYGVFVLWKKMTAVA